MSPVWLAFACGMIVGGSIGIVAMGIFVMAGKQSRERAARQRQQGLEADEAQAMNMAGSLH